MTTASNPTPTPGNTPPSYTHTGRIVREHVESATDTARQQTIENHLSMALFHVRQGDGPLSIQAATGRAVRAATLLKLQCDETTNGGRA